MSVAARVTLVAGLTTAGAAHAEPLPVSERAGEVFGAAVAIDGDRIVVGAPGTSAGGFHAGLVHVFEREGDGWRLAAQVMPDEPRAYAAFGECLALRGDVLVVGAPVDYDDPSDTPQGRGYVFERAGDGWHEALVLALEDDANDLGCPLALGRERAVFAASRRRAGTELLDPVLIVAARTGGWHEEARIEVQSRYYPEALAMDDDQIVFVESESDGLRVMRREGASWKKAEVLEISGTSNLTPYLGGDALVVESPYAGLFLFARDGASWRPDGQIELPEGENIAGAVGLDGTRLVYSVSSFDAATGTELREVRFVERGADGWQQTDAIDASAGGWVKYGEAVALSGGRVVIGDREAGAFEGERAGEALVFAGPPWALEEVLVAGELEASGCGCRGEPGGAPWMAWVLLLLGRRRRAGK